MKEEEKKEECEHFYLPILEFNDFINPKINVKNKTIEYSGMEYSIKEVRCIYCHAIIPES